MQHTYVAKVDALAVLVVYFVAVAVAVLRPLELFHKAEALYEVLADVAIAEFPFDSAYMHEA